MLARIRKISESNGWRSQAHHHHSPPAARAVAGDARVHHLHLRPRQVLHHCTIFVPPRPEDGLPIGGVNGPAFHHSSHRATSHHVAHCATAGEHGSHDEGENERSSETRGDFLDSKKT